MLIIISSIYVIGFIFAYFNIKHHNSLCDISKQLEDAKMSGFSAVFSWLYFIVEHHTFGVGEIPDDIADRHAPDDDKHFNNHLFLDK